MQFYEHFSTIDWLKRNLDGDKAKAEMYAKIAFGQCLASGDQTSAAQFREEMNWQNAKRPYYLVYPSVIPLLTRINLDFPGDCVRFPTGMQALAIRFSKGHNKIMTPFGEVQTILAAKVEINQDKLRVKGASVGLGLWINAGEKVPRDFLDADSIPVFDYALFPLNSMPIQECLENCPSDNPEVQISTGWRNEVVRLVITLMLIQDDPNLINPDVLSKDEAALREALHAEDLARIEVLKNRAFRRRGPGWEIGKLYEPTSGPYVVPPHPQRYWVGKGRTQVVIKTRSGYVVDREKITKIPSGFSNQ